jgi:hypothetical protein
MANAAKQDVDLDVGRAGIAAIEGEGGEGRFRGVGGVAFGRVHIDYLASSKERRFATAVF